MLNNAISKIQTEMNGAANNSYIQAVGSFLLQHLETNPGSAEKIMASDKTIAKSLEEMRKAAEKKKFGNCAMLTDAEGFAVVLKYFGIEMVAVGSVMAAKTANIPAPVTSSQNAEIDFDVKLEDLL
jgi:hypothetical protein